jgi:Lar family restriction alleviation protein
VNDKPGPCPFCGSTEINEWGDDSKRHYYMSCGKCWATGPDVDVRSEAIRLWNLPNKRLDNLRAEYERRNESVIKLGHVHLGQEPEYRKGEGR